MAVRMTQEGLDGQRAFIFGESLKIKDMNDTFDALIVFVGMD